MLHGGLANLVAFTASHGPIYQERFFSLLRDNLHFLYPRICKTFLSSVYCRLEEVPAAEWLLTSALWGEEGHFLVWFLSSL